MPDAPVACRSPAAPVQRFLGTIHGHGVILKHLGHEFNHRIVLGV
jgi:hypothetical protein